MAVSTLSEEESRSLKMAFDLIEKGHRGARLGNIHAAGRYLAGALYEHTAEEIRLLPGQLGQEIEELRERVGECAARLDKKQAMTQLQAGVEERAAELRTSTQSRNPMPIVEFGRTVIEKINQVGDTADSKEKRKG